MALLEERLGVSSESELKPNSGSELEPSSGDLEPKFELSGSKRKYGRRSKPGSLDFCDYDEENQQIQSPTTSSSREVRQIIKLL